MITEYVYKLLEEEVKLKKHFVPVSEMRVPYKMIHQRFQPHVMENRE